MQVINYNSVYLQERSLQDNAVVLPKLANDLPNTNNEVDIKHLSKTSLNLRSIATALVGTIVAQFTVGGLAVLVGLAIGSWAAVVGYVTFLVVCGFTEGIIAAILYMYSEIAKNEELGTEWVYHPAGDPMIDTRFLAPVLLKRSTSDDSVLDSLPNFLEIIKKISGSLDENLEISAYERKNHTIIEAKAKENGKFISDLFGSNSNYSMASSSIYYHFRAEDIKVEDINLEDIRLDKEFEKDNLERTNTNRTLFEAIEKFIQNDLFEGGIRNKTESGGSVCVKLPVSKDRRIPVQIDVEGFREDSVCV